MCNNPLWRTNESRRLPHDDTALGGKSGDEVECQQKQCGSHAIRELDLLNSNISLWSTYFHRFARRAFIGHKYQASPRGGQGLTEARFSGKAGPGESSKGHPHTCCGLTCL